MKIANLDIKPDESVIAASLRLQRENAQAQEKLREKESAAFRRLERKYEAEPKWKRVLREDFESARQPKPPKRVPATRFTD
jgi:hypothetical protein